MINMKTSKHGETVFIIGAGAIGKVLAVCLSNDRKKVRLATTKIWMGWLCFAINLPAMQL